MRTQYFDSRFVFFWKVVHTAVQKTTPGGKTLYFSVPELENSVFPDLVPLSCTPVATNSFSCPPLRSSYTATLSSTCFWIFQPSGILSDEETDVGRQRLNWALESLFTFTLLVFRTKKAKLAPPSSVWQVWLSGGSDWYRELVSTLKADERARLI